MPLSFPSSLQWYKKPSYVDLNQFATTLGERLESSGSRRSSTESRRSTEIPSKLRLEKILQNQTCSPMSLYDFYMYLKHIEHSPENLEFYVWFKNFEAGRLTSIPEFPSETHPQHHPEGGSRTNLSHDEKSLGATSVEEINKGLDFEEVNTDEIYEQIASLVNPMCGCMDPNKPSRLTKPFSAIADKLRTSPTDAATISSSESSSASSSDLAHARRTELDAITVLFLLPGAPKELNIPSTMRNAALSALQGSTSAEHLRAIADHCYILLKNCSHRNFIRLGVSNGTFETVCVATSLGIVLTVAGFLCMFLLAFCSPSLHHGSRWKGLAAWPMWGIGIGLILSGLRGSCFFLLLFSRRQPLPWERFEDDEEVTRTHTWPVALLKKLMIFDRKLKVKDDNLRWLQRKIVIQSLLGGMIFATMMEILFLCLPIWK